MRRPAKTCPVCESGVRVLDYKDDRTLGRFLTERPPLRSRNRPGYGSIGKPGVTSSRRATTR